MNIDDELLTGILFTLGSSLWFISMFVPPENITYSINWWLNIFAAFFFTIGSLYQVKYTCKK